MADIKALVELREGIPIPEYDVVIPWLIDKGHFLKLIPKEAKLRFYKGWPLLSFTLLGIHATFRFDFVTHYKQKLISVNFSNNDQSSMRLLFKTASNALIERLGPPNIVGSAWIMRWDDDFLRVDNRISVGRKMPENRRVISHDLSILAAFGLPRGGEEAVGIHARIRDLFNALPGVKIDWVQPAPGIVRFGLAVSDSRTLSRLIHMATLINVPVAVEVAWACRCGGTDPDCVRYDFRVPTKEGDERLELLEERLRRLL